MGKPAIPKFGKAVWFYSFPPDFRVLLNRKEIKYDSKND